MRSSSGATFMIASISMVFGFATRPSIATVHGDVFSVPAYLAGSSLPGAELVIVVVVGGPILRGQLFVGGAERALHGLKLGGAERGLDQRRERQGAGRRGNER
jgi:hypothetical protein